MPTFTINGETLDYEITFNPQSGEYRIEGAYGETPIIQGMPAIYAPSLLRFIPMYSSFTWLMLDRQQLNDPGAVILNGQSDGPVQMDGIFWPVEGSA